jgi:bidirectional [NiFe] hydrogenase diaphorase subunit
MEEIKTLTVDGELISAPESSTILSAARDHGIEIPTLCQLDGLMNIGACRICLVEIEGSNKLLPACVTRVEEGMVVNTRSPRLLHYRRLILELLFAEGNHVCSVCVANNHCELQNLGYAVGMDAVRFDYLYPEKRVDATHERFVLDHNRCVLCTRCVRVCDEIEGAHTWDMAGRGIDAFVITDMAGDWGASNTCTSCGKCVLVCPTGALFEKGKAVAEMTKNRDFLQYIVNARAKQQWVK